jgi:hypothetical protein
LLQKILAYSGLFAVTHILSIEHYSNKDLSSKLDICSGTGSRSPSGIRSAALLRHLHAVLTTGQRWDPAIAAGGRPRPPALIAA